MITPITLLFDMDGTLLDSSRAVVEAVASGLRDARSHHGLPPVDPDYSLIRDCMGLPSQEYFRQAFPPDSVPANLREAFSLTFCLATEQREQEAIAHGETSLFATMPETLTRLRGRGHRLLLFSNAGRAYFHAVVAGHDLERWFERTLCLEDAIAQGVARDKTEMAKALLSDPCRSVVVGDRIHDIEAGRAAGTRTVGCLYGFGRPDELRAADWLIDGPEKLLDLPLGS